VREIQRQPSQSGDVSNSDDICSTLLESVIGSKGRIGPTENDPCVREAGADHLDRFLHAFPPERRGPIDIHLIGLPPLSFEGEQLGHKHGGQAPKSPPIEFEAVTRQDAHSTTAQRSVWFCGKCIEEAHLTTTSPQQCRELQKRHGLLETCPGKPCIIDGRARLCCVVVPR
jgi:hypothetical protein